MAKDKKNKKAKAEEKESKVQEREFEYGVEDLAEELGIKPASVRVQLRNKGIEKAGKAYGWNSKKELREVLDQIRSAGDEEDEKPAKKSKDKKANKSSKKSKRSKSDDDDE